MDSAMPRFINVGGLTLNVARIKMINWNREDGRVVIRFEDESRHICNELDSKAMEAIRAAFGTPGEALWGPNPS